MYKPLRLIAYDIADPTRLRRIEKIVKAFADRVQDSVFEGPLSGEQLARLRARAAAKMDADKDSLRVYTLCAACAKQIERLGVCAVTTGESEVV